jgi:hypothetical protein
LLKLPSSSGEDTSQVRLLHELAKIDARFDDPHLVSRAGLVPMMALAQRAGLGDRAAEHVRIARPCGVNAPVKTACLAAGMAAGRTASRTWTCCATARCRACAGHPRSVDARVVPAFLYLTLTTEAAQTGNPQRLAAVMPRQTAHRTSRWRIVRRIRAGEPS